MDEWKIDQREINEQQELPMPLTSMELLVLMRCLVLATESEHVKETDKEVVRRLRGRINRYAERQGAYWDK
jgi:hypothetical protein